MKLAKIKSKIGYELLQQLSKCKDKPYDFIANLKLGEYDEYFNDENLSFPLDEDQIEMPKIGNEPLDDFEFGKILFESLQNITLADANDKNLWMYLSLFVYKGWTINRGNYKSTSTLSTIKENLFFEGYSAAPNYSNHISRLWWAFKRTERDDIEDRYYYTKILLSNSQIWFDLSERKDIYSNKKLLEAILEFINEKVVSKKFTSTKLSSCLSPLILNHLKNFSLINSTKDEIKKIFQEFLDHLLENGYLKAKS